MRDPDGRGGNGGERKTISKCILYRNMLRKHRMIYLEAGCDHWKWWWGASEGNGENMGKYNGILEWKCHNANLYLIY